MSIYRDAGKIFFSPPFFPDPGQPEDPENIPRTAQEDELDEVRLALGEAMRARYEGTDQSYALWFDKLRLVSLQADRAVFACENNLKARIISDRFRDLILEALEEVLGYRPGLELKVDPPAAQDGQPKTGSQGSLSREDQIPLPPGSGGRRRRGRGLGRFRSGRAGFYRPPRTGRSGRAHGRRRKGELGKRIPLLRTGRRGLLRGQARIHAF